MKACLWMARLIGLGVAGLVAAIAVGQRFNPLALGGAEMALSAALFAALLGMLALWRWPGWGSALALAGMTAFYAINWTTSGRLPGGWVLPLCFVPGVLGAIYWSITHARMGARRSRSNSAAP
ncbi:MAG: hypothetical protein R3C10_14015 [Pirellulales bacterium]|nr:hypothetical protein [Planctomycetales bacterium]